MQRQGDRLWSAPAIGIPWSGMVDAFEWDDVGSWQYAVEIEQGLFQIFRTAIAAEEKNRLVECRSTVRFAIHARDDPEIVKHRRDR